MLTYPNPSGGCEPLPNARVNVMDQYRSQWRAHEAHELMQRPFEEYGQAVELGVEVGLV